MKIRKLTFLILMGLLLSPIFTESGQAQESATILATATVIAAISIIGNNNLRFGTVMPGINKTVDKADVGFAGEWSIQGTGGSEVTLDFVLPDTMWVVDSSAGLRLAFNNSDASYDDGSGGGQTVPVGILNPNGQSVTNLGGLGALLVWIGGTVFPNITQTGGNYDADVILTVAYTGN